MKRGLVVSILFLSVFSLTLVSAGLFSGFFGRSTGNAVFDASEWDVTQEVWEGASAIVSCPAGSEITDVEAYYYCPNDIENRSTLCSVSASGQSKSFDAK